MIIAMKAINNLRVLQHFVLAAEELNFARAAARAHLSQTPFGRSIQTLEDDLGLRLFDRTTRSVTLTSAGRQVLARAHTLLAHARNFDEEMRALAGAVSGKVAFGASQFAVDSILPGVLSRLRAQSPGLQVHAHINQWDNLLAELDSDRIEFFIAFPGSLAKRSDYRLTALPSQPASFFCRSGHPLLQLGRAPTRNEALNYPWGALDISNTTIETVSASMGLSPENPLPIQLNCASKELLWEAMMSNDMVAATWSSWLDERLMSGAAVDLGQLIRPAIAPGLRIARCALVERSGRTLSPQARRLREAILVSVGLDPLSVQSST